jgi:intraflagellar transport protein 46
MPFDEAIPIEGSESIDSGQEDDGPPPQPAGTQTQQEMGARRAQGGVPREIMDPANTGAGKSATGTLIPPNAYDPTQYTNLKTSAEITELFQYISRYHPHDIELETRVKPFIPDYIPAVGEVDAFLKVPRPDGAEEVLGLQVLVTV